MRWRLRFTLRSRKPRTSSPTVKHCCIRITPMRPFCCAARNDAMADAAEKVGHENRAIVLITRGESQCVVCSCFAKTFDKTPSEALGLASCSIGDYNLVLPGQPFVRCAASKFKTVPSVTLTNHERRGRPAEDARSRCQLRKNHHRCRFYSRASTRATCQGGLRGCP